MHPGGRKMSHQHETMVQEKGHRTYMYNYECCTRKHPLYRRPLSQPQITWKPPGLEENLSKRKKNKGFE